MTWLRVTGVGENDNHGIRWLSKKMMILLVTFFILSLCIWSDNRLFRDAVCVKSWMSTLILSSRETRRIHVNRTITSFSVYILEPIRLLPHTHTQTHSHSGSLIATKVGEVEQIRASSSSSLVFMEQEERQSSRLVEEKEKMSFQ
jgi:hypothetical protein